MMDDDMAPSGEHPGSPNRERAAPEALRALDEVIAPDRLRLAVAQQVAGSEPAHALRRRRIGGALTAAWTLAVVLLAVVLAGGGEDRASAPSVGDVAHVALRPALEPAPAARPGGELLRAQAGSITFPTWTRAGWRAVGERTDTIGGRELRTVFYVDTDGRRIGYAIADALLPVAGGRVVMRRGARLRVIQRGTTSVVTWRRGGQTCILAGRDVPLGRLVTLAGYAA